MDKWDAERGSRNNSTGSLYKYLRTLKNVLCTASNEIKVWKHGFAKKKYLYYIE